MNAIQELIKGERSAVETYNQVLSEYGEDSKLFSLRQFSSDHKNAISTLSRDAMDFKTEIPTSSGAWGSWAKLVTGTANVISEKAALKALKEGEEHGLKEYQSALSKEDLPIKVKNHIRESLIPTQREHIREIDRLMEAV